MSPTKHSQMANPPQMPSRSTSDPFLTNNRDRSGTSSSTSSTQTTGMGKMELCDDDDKRAPTAIPRGAITGLVGPASHLTSGPSTSPSRLSILKQSASSLRYAPTKTSTPIGSKASHLNSSTSSTASSISSPANKKGDRTSRPVHLPNLNLSSIKKYAGWGSANGPVNPPTPLAHPPTPLMHPPPAFTSPYRASSNGLLPSATPPTVSALKLTRTDQNGREGVHPFACNEPKQYMAYNLDSAGTPLSPPPTPGHPLASASAQLPRSINIATPPHYSSDKQLQVEQKKQQPPAPIAAVQPSSSKVAPTPAKTGSIPASTKFLAEHGLLQAFAEQYEIVDELGSGGFGFVVRARRRRDNLIVAVKFIFRERIPSHGWVRARGWIRDGTPDGQEKLVPLEAYVLRMVRHRGVVAFLDLLEDERVFYLVMEHHGTPWVIPDRDDPSASTSAPVAFASAQPAPSSHSSSSSSEDAPDMTFSSSLSVSPSSSLGGGPLTPISPLPSQLVAPPPMLRRSSCDLFECIEQHTRFPEDQARFIFGQIVDVVYHLASMGICHRDIKDENIVVDKDFRVKLIDFGSAIIYDARKEPPYHSRFFGTVNFAASEILQGKAYRAPHAEVWSLGVLLSVLLTGETPFCDPAHAIKGRISKPKCAISREAMDLMLGCLEVDPEMRFNISNVRSHPWLAYPNAQQ